MKLFTAILLLATAAGALADLPKKGPLPRYSGLWTNSPFTSKPPVVGPTAEVNPLEDYALGGVSPIPGGYRITLFNKKNPDERIVLPDRTDFKIMSVAYATGNPLGTTVRLSTGGREGTVAFDEKLLTLKAAPAAQPVNNNPNNLPINMPGANPNPGVPTNPNDAVRQPRPRVVTQPNAGAPVNGVNTVPPGMNNNVQPQQQRPNIVTPSQQRPNRR